MSESCLLELLGAFGYSAGDEVSLLLLEYLRLLEKWNTRINLVSSTEWRILGPHFHESIWAARMYPDQDLKHLDIGSGGGFPALPIQILRPRLKMDLVEAASRKAVFLEHAAGTLGLRGVSVHNARLHPFLASQESDQSWGIISWKAVRPDATEIDLLCSRGSEDLKFWLFHGKELPVKDADHFLSLVDPVARHEVPLRRRSYLSVFTCRRQAEVDHERAPGIVSRETQKDRRNPPA